MQLVPPGFLLCVCSPTLHEILEFISAVDYFRTSQWNCMLGLLGTIIQLWIRMGNGQHLALCTVLNWSLCLTGPGRFGNNNISKGVVCLSSSSGLPPEKSLIPDERKTILNDI